MSFALPRKFLVFVLAVVVIASGCSNPRTEVSTATLIVADSDSARAEPVVTSTSSGATFEALCDITSIAAATWLYETNSILRGDSEQFDGKSNTEVGLVTLPMSFVSIGAPDMVPYDSDNPDLTPPEPVGSDIEVVLRLPVAGIRSDLTPVDSPENLVLEEGPLLVFVAYRGIGGESSIEGTAHWQGDRGISFDGPCGEIRNAAFAAVAVALDAEPTLEFLLQWRNDIREGDYQKYLDVAEASAEE